MLLHPSKLTPIFNPDLEERKKVAGESPVMDREILKYLLSVLYQKISDSSFN